MSDKTALEISEELRQFIEALVEEVVLDGKTLENQKKYLQRFCQTEGVDYNQLENNLSDLFETALELKTHESKASERFLRLLGKECYLFDDNMENIISAINKKRAELEEEDGKRAEDKTFEQRREELLKSRLITNKCPECGNTNIPDGSKFCNECGTPLNGGSIGSSQSDSSTGSPIIDNLIANMVYVEGGTFMMGATSEQVDDAFNAEKPAHRVTLSSFSIGCYEVTQEEWEAVMFDNPSHFKGKKRPVECVCWDDCQEFISKLNAMTGKTFRLPTEAEWEYSARGGNKSKGYKYSGSNNINAVAWYGDNSGKTTHPVGQKSPNELGLYDMSGNVFEWCSDWSGFYRSFSQTNPKGDSSGIGRVRRGGSWQDNARLCRVSQRDRYPPDRRGYYLGFRLAL